MDTIIGQNILKEKLKIDSFSFHLNSRKSCFESKTYYETNSIATYIGEKETLENLIINEIKFNFCIPTDTIDNLINYYDSKENITYNNSWFFDTIHRKNIKVKFIKGSKQWYFEKAFSTNDNSVWSPNNSFRTIKSKFIDDILTSLIPFDINHYFLN